MNILTDLGPEQILAISENAPEKLFSGDLLIAKSEYRMLGRRWHPDHNSDGAAQLVFQHVTRLYQKAREMIETNHWRGAGNLELQRDGRVMRRVSYFRIVPFELGEMYLGEGEVVFSVEQQYRDLFENAKNHIANFCFADSAMKREIERCLPPRPEFYSTSERLLMLVRKTPDLILLDDLREYLGGEVAPCHVGWIQNTIHNLSCYLSYAGLVHHDLSPQTYFVSPAFHTGVLLGGWWYACREGEKMKALPDRTIRIAPADVIRRKCAAGRTDLELIRATGRELLGDPTGTHLRADKKIPAPFLSWFNGATTGNALLEYELWKEVLRESFGAPRFVKLDVKPSAIYRQMD